MATKPKTILLNKGFVYFLTIVDPSKNYLNFPYYKIGLTVGDIGSRIKKLQTGNPFQIIKVEKIESEACNMLESHLHNIHSSKRVGVEWFKFDKDEFETIYKDGLNYNKQLNQMVLNVRDIESEPSNGKVIEATSEVKKLHEEIISLHCSLKNDTALKEITEIELENLTGNSLGISDITDVLVTDPEPRFSRNTFLEKYFSLCKDLMSPYQNHLDDYINRQAEKQIVDSKLIPLEAIFGRDKIEKNYSWKYATLGKPRINSKEFAKYFDVYPKLKKTRAERSVINPSSLSNDIIQKNNNTKNLHNDYLNLLVRIGEIEAKIGLHELELRYHCGVNDGIADVCTYIRKIEETKIILPSVEKTSLKTDSPSNSKQKYTLDDFVESYFSHLDEELISSEYPEEYRDCFITSPPQRRFKVIDYRSYL